MQCSSNLWRPNISPTGPHNQILFEILRKKKLKKIIMYSFTGINQVFFLVSTELFPWTYHVCGMHLELPFLIPSRLHLMHGWIDGKLEKEQRSRYLPLLSGLFPGHASNFLRPTDMHAPFPTMAAFVVHIPRFVNVLFWPTNQSVHTLLYYYIIIYNRFAPASCMQTSTVSGASKEG